MRNWIFFLKLSVLPIAILCSSINAYAVEISFERHCKSFEMDIVCKFWACEIAKKNSTDFCKRKNFRVTQLTKKHSAITTSYGKNRSGICIYEVFCEGQESEQSHLMHEEP